MSDSKIECFIDFDDEWIQDRCHWEYKRVFTLSWKINCILGRPPENTENPIEIYYRVGGYDESLFLSDYTRLTRDKFKDKSGEQVSNEALKNFTYNLRLTEAELISLASSNSITLLVNAYSATESKWLSGHYTLEYICKLPPQLPLAPTPAARLEKISSTQAIFSWNKVDDADGYCVELFCKKADSESYENVRGLSLSESGNYIIKNEIAPITPLNDELDDESIDDESIITFASTYIDTEVYITDPTVTSVSFSPRQMGFDKKDEYKLIVYPYIKCAGENATLLDSTLLGGNGTESNAEEFKLGIVRVKTADGWTEGQVWIRTKDAWVEAEGVYTKTTTGWKESI